MLREVHPQLAAIATESGSHAQAALAALWGREAALLGAGLLLQCDDSGPEQQAAALRLARRLPGLVLLAGHRWPAQQSAP